MSINRSIKKLIKYAVIFGLGFYTKCSIDQKQIEPISMNTKIKLENIVRYNHAESTIYIYNNEIQKIS